MIDCDCDSCKLHRGEAICGCEKCLMKRHGNEKRPTVPKRFEQMSITIDGNTYECEKTEICFKDCEIKLDK